MSAVVATRRVSAGIKAAPGATSSLPAWWGDTDWLEVEVAGALAEHPDVLADHHVSARACTLVARWMAAYADFRTGRNCRPTNARLVEHTGLSLSTVQRARRALKALDLVVQTVAGQTFMTLQQRLECAWPAGSAHRAVAAEFALCSRRDRSPGTLVAVPTPVENPSSDPDFSGRDTPPSATPVSTSLTLRRTHSSGGTEMRRAAARPHAPNRGGRPSGGRLPVLDVATRRLAEDVQRRLGWLRGVSPRRITPTLSRFARAGWTARDFERAVDEQLRMRSWRVPTVLDQPAAYLAGLLRDVDPGDRPGALDELVAAREAAQRLYERRLVWGAPCPHGMPAGAEPSPLRGLLACPDCRREAEAAAASWPDVAGPAGAA